MLDLNCPVSPLRPLDGDNGRRILDRLHVPRIMNVPITRLVWGMLWIDDSKDVPIGMVCVWISGDSVSHEHKLTVPRMIESDDKECRPMGLLGASRVLRTCDREGRRYMVVMH
jgi:hypothetical protein